jgi:hypothetical protein
MQLDFHRLPHPQAEAGRAQHPQTGDREIADRPRQSPSAPRMTASPSRRTRERRMGRSAAKGNARVNAGRAVTGRSAPVTGR